MLRICALMVFGETDSCPAIGPGQVCRQVPQHPSSPGLAPWPAVRAAAGPPGMRRAGRRGCRRAARRARSGAGQRLQQPGRAGHRERQDQPVGLGESQRPFGGLVRRALVAELTMGEPGQQVRLHDRDVPEERRPAVQDTGDRGQSCGRIAFGQADRRAGVPVRPRLVIERRRARRGPARSARGGPGWPAASRSPGWPAPSIPPAAMPGCRPRRTPTASRWRPRPACTIQSVSCSGGLISGPVSFRRARSVRRNHRSPSSNSPSNTIEPASIIGAGAGAWFNAAAVPFGELYRLAGRPPWVVANERIFGMAAPWKIDAKPSCARQPTSR